MHAYHVVITTHNSRTSSRMIKYQVKKGDEVRLTLQQEITISGLIRDIILQNDYKCLAYNICTDHVHLILVCELADLSDMVKMINGRSSYLYKKAEESAPIKKLWSSRFFRANLDVWEIHSHSKIPGQLSNDSHLDNAIRYIIQNREKHNLEVSEELNEIIKEFVISKEVAFSGDYG